MNILLFENEVKDKAKIYHWINTGFFVLSILSILYMIQASGMPITDSEVFFSFFLTQFSLYTMAFIFFRISILSYQEKLRNNFYQHQLLLQAQATPKENPQETKVNRPTTSGMDESAAESTTPPEMD